MSDAVVQDKTEVPQSMMSRLIGGAPTIAGVVVLLGLIGYGTFHHPKEHHAQLPGYQQEHTTDPNVASAITTRTNQQTGDLTTQHAQQTIPYAQVMAPARQDDPMVTEEKRLALEHRMRAAYAPALVPPTQPGAGQQGGSLSGLPSGVASPGGPDPGISQAAWNAAAMLGGIPGGLPAGMPGAVARGLSASPVGHAGPAPVMSTNQGNPFIVPTGAMNQFEGKSFFVREGTILHCALLHKLDGEFQGPVSCSLTQPLTSANGTKTLIPVEDTEHPGYLTTLIGEAKEVDHLNQRRLAITFHKAVMPDNFEVWFDDLEAQDNNGTPGIHGRVNNHYLQTFGVSLAIGVLGAAAELGTGSVLNENGLGRMQEGAGIGLSTASMTVLSKFLNRLPSVTVKAGTPIDVYLAADYQIPEYSSHKMPNEM